jgi:hypothetical protein
MFRQGIWLRDGGITHALEQPGRDALLGMVADTRREHPIADREGLGRWAVSVPFEDWLGLIRKYPDLQAPDAQIKTRAWLRFIASDESNPYRMREGRI